MHRRAARLIIRGDVQGVGYRWWVCTEATRLGLAGWVRNRADGSVEVVAAGKADAVDQLADACGRGPAAARVVSVKRSETRDPGVTGFDARPSA